MISVQIRRMAAIVHAETGQSIQEIIEAVVVAVQSGIVDYRSRRCPVCGSSQSVTTCTKSSDRLVLRYHRCDFCGVTFRSEEKKIVPSTTKLPEPIVKKKPKTHIKRRGA